MANLRKSNHNMRGFSLNGTTSYSGALLAMLYPTTFALLRFSCTLCPQG